MTSVKDAALKNLQSENVNQTELTSALIYKTLRQVKDPEIPVISIEDLGVLQKVLIDEKTVRVEIIPTYSGCPAMQVIKSEIHAVLEPLVLSFDIEQLEVEVVDDPIWTTDMITTKGKAAMQAYGIAPPLAADERVIKCPQCGSENTSCISEFGSTACKALYRCEACLEPFDYFKCHA